MWSDGGCDPCRGVDVAGQLARAGAGELVAAPGGACDTCGATPPAGGLHRDPVRGRTNGAPRWICRRCLDYLTVADIDPAAHPEG